MMFLLQLLDSTVVGKQPQLYGCGYAPKKAYLSKADGHFWPMGYSLLIPSLNHHSTSLGFAALLSQIYANSVLHLTVLGVFGG